MVALEWSNVAIRPFHSLSVSCSPLAVLPASLTLLTRARAGGAAKSQNLIFGTGGSRIFPDRYYPVKKEEWGSTLREKFGYTCSGEMSALFI